jgi:hypothetical protein
VARKTVTMHDEEAAMSEDTAVNTFQKNDYVIANK